MKEHHSPRFPPLRATNNDIFYIFASSNLLSRPITRISRGVWGGANEAKVDQTTEMYFWLSDPFIWESSNTWEIVAGKYTVGKYPHLRRILRIESKSGFLRFITSAFFWERIWKKYFWQAVSHAKMVHNSYRHTWQFSPNVFLAVFLLYDRRHE